MRRDSLNPLAADVRAGLGGAGQKWLPARWLYDALGSALFEAITHLPEYGVTRADARVIARLAPGLGLRLPGPLRVVELGCGSGAKTGALLHALSGRVAYHPIDVSAAALTMCVRALEGVTAIEPEEGEYLAGLARVLARRRAGERVLLLFLGSTIGNFEPAAAREFLAALHTLLQAGDALLLGADLVKPAAVLVAAYDDPTGVTAAFNRNLLGRLNRELGADFDLRNYAHEARWNAAAARIEMHLRATRRARVAIPGAELVVELAAGETIWTESSHKFTPAGLAALAAASGWQVAAEWHDESWPFAELLLGR